jgi:ABC-type lipoprotein export system ATPase subunit
MSSLALINVSYKYKNSQTYAVEGVNFEFGPAKLHAVAGPSGSGKSTLLSLLAGLDHPTEGEVIFNGESLAKLDLDRYRRESIAMIFQSFQLFPLLTAMENVCYPMELSGMRPADAKLRAGQLLESVGIAPQQMTRFPAHLSGGEQQRVAIARGLAMGAKILLADEPTGNLDSANTRNVMEILHKLAREQEYCVIVVTHDPEVAREADIVLRMKDGRLVMDPEETATALK